MKFRVHIFGRFGLRGCHGPDGSYEREHGVCIRAPWTADDIHV